MFYEISLEQQQDLSFSDLLFAQHFVVYEGGPRIGGFCPQSSDLFESAGNPGNAGQKPPIRGPPSYTTKC